MLLRTDIVLGDDVRSREWTKSVSLDKMHSDWPIWDCANKHCHTAYMHSRCANSHCHVIYGIGAYVRPNL